MDMNALDRLVKDRIYAGENRQLQQHAVALSSPFGIERAIFDMLRGWLHYVDEYRRDTESGIGEDRVLGPEWRDLGRALYGLLNGPTGRLDCGTLYRVIDETLKAEGFEHGLNG